MCINPQHEKYVTNSINEYFNMNEWYNLFVFTLLYKKSKSLFLVDVIQEFDGVFLRFRC